MLALRNGHSLCRIFHLTLGESHLVVAVERAAVDTVVVAPEHGDQLSCMEAIHGHWASTWHKHKLRAAASWHCELQPLTTLVAHFPIIYLRGQQSRGMECSERMFKYKLNRVGCIIECVWNRQQFLSVEGCIQNKAIIYRFFIFITLFYFTVGKINTTHAFQGTIWHTNQQNNDIGTGLLSVDLTSVVTLWWILFRDHKTHQTRCLHGVHWEFTLYHHPGAGEKAIPPLRHYLFYVATWNGNTPTMATTARCSRAGN